MKNFKFMELNNKTSSTDVHFSETNICFFLSHSTNPQSSSYKYANEALRAVALPLGPIGTSVILKVL